MFRHFFVIFGEFQSCTSLKQRSFYVTKMLLKLITKIFMRLFFIKYSLYLLTYLLTYSMEQGPS